MTDADPRPLDSGYRAQLTEHGIMASLAGMLGGMSFLFNILQFIEILPLIPKINKKVPGTEPAWRAAHTGPIMNGMLLMSIGAAGSTVKLTPREQRALVFLLLVTVWGNTLGYNAAAVAGERGLRPKGNKLNNLAYVSFLAAALSVLTALPLAIRGVRRHRAEQTEAVTPLAATAG